MDLPEWICCIFDIVHILNEQQTLRISGYRYLVLVDTERITEYGDFVSLDDEQITGYRQLHVSGCQMDIRTDCWI